MNYQPHSPFGQDYIPVETPNDDEILPILEWMVGADWSGTIPPARKFHDGRQFIPHEGVTLLYGDGGTGKSLLALQLACSTVWGLPWLGSSTKQGPAVYFSAEDSIDEMHRRTCSIAEFMEADMGDLTDLHILPMVGLECVLGSKDKKGLIRPTPLLESFEQHAIAVNPKIIIIDNLIDVFSGDQNDPCHAKQFIHILTGLAQRCDCPIVLLAHPSKGSMKSGVGDSGSPHWSNSARSRLSLERIYFDDSGNGNVNVEPDPLARKLVRKKANYAPKNSEVIMGWNQGVFIHEADESGSNDPQARAQKNERVFLHLVRWHNDKEISVTASTGPNFAPAVFAKHPMREGLTKRDFRQAMNVLLERNCIEHIEHGPPSRRRKKLIIVEGTA